MNCRSATEEGEGNERGTRTKRETERVDDNVNKRGNRERERVRTKGEKGREEWVIQHKNKGREWYTTEDGNFNKRGNRERERTKETKRRQRENKKGREGE